MTPAAAFTLTATISLASLVACGNESSDPTSAPAAPALQVAGHHPPRFSDWSEPVNLGPVVNSESSDIEVTLARDGLSLYFASNRAGGYGRQDIYVSRRASVDEPWGPPQNLGPTINSAFDDRAPALTPDGHRLYFASDRLGFGAFDLYVALRRDNRDDLGWQSPENLGEVINTAFNENLPSYSEAEDGTRTLYFNSGRPSTVPGTGLNDIYASTLRGDGTFGPPVLVAEISSPLRDAKVEFRRDGLELFLTSDRAGTLGTFDVWTATRASTRDLWSTPVNLGPVINTTVDEGRIALSFDGTMLYITGSRLGGVGQQDIWVSSRTKLTGSD